ncbi:hypothetical protein B6D19_10375, partial [Gilliamella apicola]|uniref:hypothetical protein n=1 Tax=Gilliamella apicola TaxID=1196095 RepID=UPI000B6410E8
SEPSASDEGLREKQEEQNLNSRSFNNLKLYSLLKLLQRLKVAVLTCGLKYNNFYLKIKVIIWH